MASRLGCNWRWGGVRPAPLEAEFSRPLALNSGYCHERYGAVPQEEPLWLVRTQTPRSKQLLLHGMKDLVLALTRVAGVMLEGGRSRATEPPPTSRVDSGVRPRRSTRNIGRDGVSATRSPGVFPLLPGAAPQQCRTSGGQAEIRR